MTTANEIADKLAEQYSIPKATAKELVNGVFAAIADAAVAGEEISLPRFGKFKVKVSTEREGRNPATGATLKIPASKKLGFTPAKALKDALNQ